MTKKMLTYSVAFATLLWAGGLLSIPLIANAAVAGDLIKLQCAAGASASNPCKAVYYLGSNNKRYVFPNDRVYKSWYDDYSGVKIVTGTELASYGIGGNVTYKPGSKLIKISTDPKVYAMGANGTLRWVTTGDIAAAIYGADWNKMVDDVSDVYFVNYIISSDIALASDYDRTALSSAAASISVDKNLVSIDGNSGITNVAYCSTASECSGFKIKIDFHDDPDCDNVYGPNFPCKYSIAQTKDVYYVTVKGDTLSGEMRSVNINSGVETYTKELLGDYDSTTEKMTFSWGWYTYPNIQVDLNLVSHTGKIEGNEFIGQSTIYRKVEDVKGDVTYLPISISDKIPKKDCLIKGDDSGESGWVATYYMPTSFSYSKIGDISSPKDWFCTEEDAVKAGYKKALQ